MESLSPFHYAFPVHDLKMAREFYGDLLGCQEGRSSDRWVDFNFYGHQIVAHLVSTKSQAAGTNFVDGDGVTVPHFGVVLPWNLWEKLSKRLVEHQVPFLIAPRIRFQGQPGEQGTFFIKDPSGNAIEMKSFRSLAQLFAK